MSQSPPLPAGHAVDRTDDDHIVLHTPAGPVTMTVDEAAALGGALIAQAMKAALRRALDPGRPDSPTVEP